MPHRYLLLLIQMLLITKNVEAGPDSVLTKKVVFRSDISASYTSEKSWWNDRQNLILVKASAEVRLRKSRASGWSHDHFMQTQVGYTRFIDSVWIKTSDAFKIQLRWNEKRSKKVNHTYQLQVQSQWLNSWAQTGAAKVWRGGFMNPSTVQVSYSFSWNFFKNSQLLLAPATLQVTTQPEKSTSFTFKERPFVTSKHSHIYSRYGFSAAVTIDEYFYQDFLCWQHRSQLFINAISAQQVQFDVSNRLCFRFLKYLQLRFDTTLIYLPEQTMRLQYKQEVLLGIFCEYRK